jgi:AcrR family transcriptional regulator
MDRRTEKTRAAIFSAFYDLLSRKSYARITVEEIIDGANIGRSTFYSHFETKDELLKTMCTDLFSHVFSAKLPAEILHDSSSAEEDILAVVSHILYHLSENGKNIRGILSCESADLFLRYFKEYLHQLVIPLMSRWETARPLPVPEDFLIHHISGSFIEMVRWWFKNDLRYSPDEMAVSTLRSWLRSLPWPRHDPFTQSYSAAVQKSGPRSCINGKYRVI